MPIKDPFGLKVDLIKLGMSSTDLVAELQERGVACNNSSVSRAISGDMSETSSRLRSKIIGCIKEIRDGKGA